jgi:hypothetical protein
MIARFGMRAGSPSSNARPAPAQGSRRVEPQGTKMENYASFAEQHLLPAFGALPTLLRR